MIEAHKCVSCWIHVSGLDPLRTPGVFYTYFYNHAHRLRLEKLLHLEPSRSSNGRFKPLWIQMTVSLLKLPNSGFRSETAVTRRFQKRNGQKFNGYIFNGHSPTEKSVRLGAAAM